MRKLLISSIAAVALVLSLTGVALASHYVYKAEDPGTQVPALGTENWVFRWWGLGTTSLWWWADSTLRSDVDTARNNWLNAVSQLTWQEVSNEGDADVAFKPGTCPGGAAACVAAWTYFYESDRDASYWETATVYLEPSYDWTTSGKRGAMAHEMGHLYGLHERYLEDPYGVCNDDEVTVMDALVHNANGELVHCDGLEGPASIDDSRVTAYWSQGEMSSLSATGSGSVGTYTWKDDAWADYRHQPRWYYWDGSAWIEYHSKYRTAEVGVHRVTEDRTLTEVIDRTTYGAPAGWHIVCGDPWFIKWGTAGTWQCSNYVWLD